MFKSCGNIQDIQICGKDKVGLQYSTLTSSLIHLKVWKKPWTWRFVGYTWSFYLDETDLNVYFIAALMEGK